jgi:energy-coupling factor transport system permease protein
MTPPTVEGTIKEIERQGWFYRTDPRIKIGFLVVFTLLNLMFLEPMALVFLTFTLVPIYATTQVNYRFLFTALLGYSFFLGAIIISQGMAPVGRMAVDPENLHYVFDFGFIHMTWEGLGIGVSRSFRFANPFLLAILMAMTTDPVLMARGMIKLKLPFEIAFMVLSGLRFLPLAIEEAQNIRDAQTVRGVSGIYNRGRSALFPLFINSLRRAQRMGITIEAKSFGAKNWNEFLRDVRIQPRDAILISYGLILLLIGLYVRFIVGWGYYSSGVANPY